MNSNKNIPQLRFPEFTGEWEEKKLKECVNRIKTGKLDANAMVDDGEYRFYTCAKEYSLIDSYAFEGDCILIAGNGAHLGYVHHYNGKFNAYQRTYVLSDFTCDSFFLEYCIKRYLPDRISEEIKDGNTPYIVLSTLTDMVIPLPNSKKEQMKIAECLLEIDNLISAQGDKVDALKEKKKGMMQQMFPQKGETTPRLRFPGFTGEWDYVDGDELFESISNKNHNSDLPILALTQDQGAVPRDMINYNVIVSDKSVAGYKVVEVDDFIISLRSFQGGIEYSRYKGLCSPAYIVLRKKSQELCSDFYRIYFKSFNYIQDLNKNLEGIRDGKMISYKQFSEIKLPKPSPSEQKKIAECLSAMDDMIASESAKLDALKDHKKGLMQQLFPQPNK